MSYRFGRRQEVELFYRQPDRQNFNFCYINNTKYYLVNCVEKLFNNINNSCTMFVNNTTYVIHSADEFCAPVTKNATSENSKTSLINYIKNLYPKQKFLPLFLNN